MLKSGPIRMIIIYMVFQVSLLDLLKKYGQTQQSPKPNMVEVDTRSHNTGCEPPYEFTNQVSRKLIQKLSLLI